FMRGSITSNKMRSGSSACASSSPASPSSASRTLYPSRWRLNFKISTMAFSSSTIKTVLPMAAPFQDDTSIELPSILPHVCPLGKMAQRLGEVIFQRSAVALDPAQAQTVHGEKCPVLLGAWKCLALEIGGSFTAVGRKVHGGCSRFEPERPGVGWLQAAFLPLPQLQPGTEHL